jgi:alpha-1,3-rhamnosyl/mannosyltransferase
VTRALEVGVNLLWLVPGVVGGSEQYTTRLIRAVTERHADDVRLTLFVNARFAERARMLAPGDVGVEVAPVSGDRKAIRVAAEATWLAAQVRGARFDVVHHAGGTVPIVHPGPMVLTIHDLQPLLLRGTFSRTKQLYLRARLRPSVHAAELVVTLSEHARRSVIDVLGASPNRVTIVRPFFEPRDAPDDPRSIVGVDGPFFLYPAIAYPHKNHVTLVRAFAALHAERPEVSLVLTGGPGAMDGAVAEAAERCGVADRVVRLGRVDRQALDALYAGAVALTFPSRFEGFGIPPLEAMTLGCPVVAAAATALPEVVADAGILVDPDDVDGWTAAMRRLLDDGDERRRLIEAGRRRAALFTAEASADALVAAYGIAAAHR